MSNILITGASGFIGKHCNEYFCTTTHTVFSPTHKELDLLKLDKVIKFINDNKIEYIIHAAALAGRKNALLKPDSVYIGLLIFENLLLASQNCKYLINFGSGAELGEYPTKDICLKKEDDLESVVTPECGGFVKSIITRRILKISKPKCFNLRIAGCFGLYEKTDRFITSNIHRVLNNTAMQIYQNQYMDFIYVEDVISLINYILNDEQNRKDNPNSYMIPPLWKDFNCVYKEKYTLVDIANIINKIMKSNTDINIRKSGMGNSYTLDGTRLNKLDLPLMGLENSIKDLYRKIIQCL